MRRVNREEREQQAKPVTITVAVALYFRKELQKLIWEHFSVSKLILGFHSQKDRKPKCPYYTEVILSSQSARSSQIPIEEENET